MCINWLLSALTDIETILNDSAARDTLEARNVAARVAVTEQNILAFPKQHTTTQSMIITNVMYLERG